MKQIDNKDMEHLFKDANDLLSTSEMFEINAGKARKGSSQTSNPCKICVGCVIAAAIIIL